MNNTMHPTLRRLLRELNQELGDLITAIGEVTDDELREDLYECSDRVAARFDSLCVHLFRRKL